MHMDLQYKISDNYHSLLYITDGDDKLASCIARCTKGDGVGGESFHRILNDLFQSRHVHYGPIVQHVR